MSAPMVRKTKTTKTGARRKARSRRPVEQLTRTAIYARISLDREQTQKGVDRQIEECEQLAEREELTIADHYVDNSIGALTGKHRPQFERLCADIASGMITHLVVWHPDRLTRNLRELLHLMELLVEHDVTVRSVKAGEWDLSSASVRLIAVILGAIAQFESELKGERMESEHHQRAKQGRTSGGGPRPFGYVDAACSAIVPHEAELLREATRRVIAGEPLNRIATSWNARGETTTQGRPWSATHLYDKLRAPRIAALRVLHGETFKGTWEPIVSRREFDRVAVILSDPSRKKRSADVPFLLHGVAVSEHGAQLVGKQSGGVRKYYGVGAGMCDESDLDALVTEALFDRIADHAATLPYGDDDHAAQREQLSHEIERLEADLARLAAMSSTLELDEYLELRAARAAQLDEMRGQLDALAPVDSVARARLNQPGVAAAEWEQLDVHERRQVVRTWVEAVVVRKTRETGPRARLSREIVGWPDRVVIKWKR